MKHEQKVKLENYKEHYNSIMGNIRVANSELEKALVLKKDAEQNLKVTKENLQKEVDELNKIHEEGSQFIKGLTIRNINLNERESKLEQRIEKYSKMEIELKDVLSTEKTRKEKLIDRYVSDKEEELEVLNNRILVKEQLRKDLRATVTTLDETKEKLSKDNQKSSDTFILESKKQRDIISNTEKEIKSKSKELSTLEEKVRKEVEKVQLPTQLLEERDTILKRKENDFLILTLRWKRFFKEHFPNQTLNL